MTAKEAEVSFTSLITVLIERKIVTVDCMILIIMILLVV